MNVKGLYQKYSPFFFCFIFNLDFFTADLPAGRQGRGDAEVLIKNYSAFSAPLRLRGSALFHLL
jgi:hypothetical protein